MPNSTTSLLSPSLEGLSAPELVRVPPGNNFCYNGLLHYNAASRKGHLARHNPMSCSGRIEGMMRLRRASRDAYVSLVNTFAMTLVRSNRITISMSFFPPSSPFSRDSKLRALSELPPSQSLLVLSLAAASGISWLLVTLEVKETLLLPFPDLFTKI